VQVFADPDPYAQILILSPSRSRIERPRPVLGFLSLLILRRVVESSRRLHGSKLNNDDTALKCAPLKDFGRTSAANEQYIAGKSLNHGSALGQLGRRHNNSFRSSLSNVTPTTIEVPIACSLHSRELAACVTGLLGNLGDSVDLDQRPKWQPRHLDTHSSGKRRRK